MKKDKNKWTLKKRLALYKLVKVYGAKWTTIADILSSTSSIVRGKYRHTNWENLFQDNDLTEKDVLEDEEIDIIIGKRAEKLSAEEYAEELIEVEKNKIVDQGERRKTRELLKKLAAQDLILNKLTSAITSVPPIQVDEIQLPDIDDVSIRSEEAVLVLSDLHLGLAVNSDEVGGITRYNKDIFIQRLDSLIENVIKITKRHRKSCRIDVLNLFMLGDNVHGSNNAGQWGFLHTEQTIVDQLFVLWDEIERAILKLKKFFPKINIHCVVGNHGRIDRRGYEKGFSNWDFVLYHMLHRTLKDQEGITWSIPRTPFDISIIQGYKFLLIHGDSVRGWGGLPFYGMVRAESKYRALLDRNINIKDIEEEAIELGIDKEDFQTQFDFVYKKVKSIDFMVMGHFHHMAELETNSGGRIIMNSSFAGGDDYSINSLLTANTASQKFFGVHPEGKSWTYDINLER